MQYSDEQFSMLRPVCSRKWERVCLEGGAQSDLLPFISTQEMLKDYPAAQINISRAFESES